MTERLSQKKSPGSSGGNFGQQRRELLPLVRGESSQQAPLGLFLHTRALLARSPSSRRERRQLRAAIVRIRLPRDQPVGFQSIDELRDIRLHAREALGQLGQRQRLVRIGQRLQRQQLGERQPNPVELGLDLILRGVRGVEDGGQVD